MKIYLVRHGETTSDVEDRYGGDYEDHLTEKGRRQSEELASKLKGKGIKVIYYSPRIRAAETAEIVNNVLDVNLAAVEDLRERNNYGVLTGMTREEAREKYPEEVRKIETIWMHHGVKGSEDYEPFKKRVLAAFEEIVSKGKPDTIAVVSHGGPISCIVREVLKLGDFEKMGDCAVIELEADEGEIRLVKMENASLKK